MQHPGAPRPDIMVASKRAAADPTKSSNENRRTCSGEGGTTESLISDELRWDNQGIWSELGEAVATYLSKSVVALAVSDGHKVLFASSGVAIACQGNGTRIVTAASLVRALEKARGNIKIEVHYEGEVVKGVLEEYDLANGIAFVKAMTTLDVHCVPLSHIDLMPETKVVVVSRDISGKLMATSGELRCSDGFGKFGNGEAGGCLMMFSTCKASEGWQGGPSFDFDGNFVGMNLVLDMERSIIFPRSRILKRWEQLQTPPPRYEGRTKGVKPYSRPQVAETYVIATLLYLELACLLISLLSSAYEDVPTTSSVAINRRIALLNAHHDPFGDLYPDGVWGEFDRSFSAFLSKNVVALASFNGGTKFFPCTGFFINFDDECQTILTSATLVREPDGSHKIVEGLEIKVLLPNNQSKVGTLKHFSLQYNVALVGVKNCRYVRHVNLEECSRNYSSEVVAVGRSFESGELMATRGARTCWSGPFDCDLLCYSTCKISKIGIGGPLVDINGKFLGMNYYDKKMGTPFLYFDDLCGILQYFKTKQTKYRSMHGEVRHICEDSDYIQNRWKLPNPSSMNKRERDEERRVLASLHPTSRRHVQYAYTDGHVTVLK